MNNVCKICFKDIKDYSLYNLVNKKHILCEECFGKLKAKFYKLNIGTVKATAIYDYSDVIKELIFKYKGCYDYELKDVFLYRYLNYLKLKYRNYYVVPVPSFHVDDEKRGFNHVIEIYKLLNLKMLTIIHKNKAHKQSENSGRQRHDIRSVLEIDKNIDMKGKKILLVDDIMTTGSTLLSCVELLKSVHAKHIEILVIAKTKRKSKTEY